MPAGVQSRGRVLLLPPVYKENKKGKNVITLYESLQKRKKCNRLVTLSLSPSELSEESKSDLHSKSKGHPKVSGRFNMFEGRVFSGGF